MSLKGEVIEPFPTLPDLNLHPSVLETDTTGSSSALNVAGARSSASAPSHRRGRVNTDGLSGDNTGPAFATAFDTVSSPPSPQNRPHRRSNRRKIKSTFKRWKTISLRHTWLNPLILILAVLSFYFASPGEQNFFRPAIFLSYPVRPHATDPTATIYGKGPRDFAFVAFYTVVLSFMRESIMQLVLKPLSVWLRVKKRARFMEQMYSAFYFALSSPFGLYVMSRSPVWYFSTPGMYIDFPHRELEGYFKAYYLLQASYWAQQAIVLMLMLEKPRKDFRELVAHHIITVSLIYLSYKFHFTYMGLAVYITHDISDFFLATSKTLNYLDSALVDPYFVIFMASWIYLRHFINLKIILSFIPYPTIGNNPHPLAQPRPEPVFSANIPGVRDRVYFWPSQFSSIGSYELNWDTQQYKCWISQSVTFVLLACLQALNLFWLYLIFRVAYRFIISGEKTDDRSDDETDVPDLPTSTEVESETKGSENQINIVHDPTASSRRSQLFLCALVIVVIIAITTTIIIAANVAATITK